MINFDDYSNENKTLQELHSHNQKWPYIPDHPQRILIIGGSGCGKTNKLLIKCISMQKIHMKRNNQYLINKREKVGLNHYNDPKVFIKYSNYMQDVYKNIDEYNTDKECKILIVFDGMIAGMINNKKLNSLVTELLLEVEN